jgi:hypothetical protein
MVMKREKDLLKKWLDEAGREAPSPGFSSRVMATIQAQEAKRSVFKPAVSPLRVKLAVAGIAAVFIGILLFAPDGNAPEGGTSSDNPTMLNWLQNRTADASQQILEGISWPVFASSDMAFNPLFGYALVALALASIFNAFLNSQLRSH